MHRVVQRVACDALLELKLEFRWTITAFMRNEAVESAQYSETSGAL
jgi:hypothetical protein